jgi:hypothetical protein
MPTLRLTPVDQPENPDVYQFPRAGRFGANRWTPPFMRPDPVKRVEWALRETQQKLNSLRLIVDDNFAGPEGPPRAA